MQIEFAPSTILSAHRLATLERAIQRRSVNQWLIRWHGSLAMNHGPGLDDDAHDVQVVETEKPAHANVVRHALTRADEQS
jgi:hypothetical protein